MNASANHGRLDGLYPLLRQRFMALTTILLFTIAGTSTAASAQDTVLPLEIDEIVFENGELVAIGSLGDNTFTTPVDLSLQEIIEDEGDVCAILDLEVGAISLDLLGLQVDTSDICLDISAMPGEGNLLGNLLCGVAGLLDSGLPLDEILAGLTDEERANLLGGLTDLLNEALDQILSPANIEGVSGSNAAPGQGNNQGQGGGRGQGQGRGQQQRNFTQCDILNLALGPVDLNLLGLQVFLDDCEGGPVTVDITAERGAGNLLGNLLCGLAGLLDSDPLDDAAIAALLEDIINEILNLL